MNVDYWIPDSEERDYKLSDIPSPTDMAKAIERVRELHKPVKSYKGRDHIEIVGCYECEETGSGREYWVEYPCPTIKALDGDL